MVSVKNSPRHFSLKSLGGYLVMFKTMRQYQPADADTALQSKSALGQYMTPPNIAKFMVSLFSRKKGQLHLLDPGAGEGALSRAFLSNWNKGAFSFQDGALDAFEIDSRMVSLFKKNIEKDILANHLSFNIQHTDFIEHAVSMILRQENPYTHAILNPPYKKINSNSKHRILLRNAGIETVNLYSAFVALSIALLAPMGQLVAIIPRSFCNGPYYKTFRKFVLQHTSILHIHLFESRNKAFKADNVLQENVVLMLERGVTQGNIAISTSTDDCMDDFCVSSHPFSSVVAPEDSDIFFHIPRNEVNTAGYLDACCHTLANIGLEVSTGPVVDFRMKEYLHSTPEKGDAPLLYPAHFKGAGEWPLVGFKKPNAIACCKETMKWLFPAGFYVVVRRMSSKEEKRRIVANAVNPTNFSDITWFGFENHLNVFHSHKQGIPENIAYGLSAYLNSSLTDSIFRRFNGHTQVNATDLRSLRYPSVEKLEEIGVLAKQQKSFEQITIDQIMETILK